MVTERRKCLRLPVSLDVVLNHRAQSVICTMRDISLGGAFIDAEPELLPYAGLVELNFSLPVGSDASLVRLSATIQRVTDNGAAVSFSDMGGDIYCRLVDWVSLAEPTAGNPTGH